VGNPDLRRLQLAWIGSNLGGWAYWVAAGVFAYGHGGARAVGAVAAVAMASAALASPLLAVLADRYPRARVMIGADVVRAGALITAAALAVADGPAMAVYALVVVIQIATTAFRPAQAALIPSLARTEAELTAANTVSSAIESASIFAGPTLGGLLLAWTNTGVVFAVTSIAFVWSALMIARIGTRERAEGGDQPTGEHVARSVLAGLAAIGRDGDLRALMALVAAPAVVYGFLNVLLVATALDVLELGRAGVGYLNSAVGVGALAGAVGMLSTAGGDRLARTVGYGVVLFGLPIAIVGLWPTKAGALALFACVGIGNTLVEVSLLTLLQRGVPDEVLARVFGVVEGLMLGTIALGAALAPLAIAIAGIRGALIVAGAIAPLTALLLWPRLRRIDRAAEPPDAAAALAEIPMLAALPRPVLEELAHNAQRRTVEVGETVFRQGDPGDHFYVVADGELDLVPDRSAPKRLLPGDAFGEIALLRGVPRTGTVTAATPGRLWALDGDAFVAAVTGHPPTYATADAAVAARLAAVQPGRV
jgi:MFS family permease